MSRLTIVALALAALPASAAFAQQQNALASAPIDVAMFREGEVQRTQRPFGAWLLSCDEVPKLHQRYCSLSTAVRDARGQTMATLYVSTGDDGRPAALLQAPLGIALGQGASFAILPGNLAASAKAKPIAPRHVDFVRCDAKACAAVWTLVPAEIAGLNGGGALSLKFRVLTSLPPFGPVAPRPDAGMAVEASNSGAGFAEAIKASVQ